MTQSLGAVLSGDEAPSKEDQDLADWYLDYLENVRGIEDPSPKDLIKRFRQDGSLDVEGTLYVMKYFDIVNDYIIEPCPAEAPPNHKRRRGTKSRTARSVGRDGSPRRANPALG